MIYFTNNWIKNRRLVKESCFFLTPFYTMVIFLMVWKVWNCSFGKIASCTCPLGHSDLRMIPGTHMVGRDTTSNCPLTPKFINLSHFHNFSTQIYFLHLKEVKKIKFVFSVLKWTNKNVCKVKFQAGIFFKTYILTVLTCSGRGHLVNPGHLALK